MPEKKYRYVSVCKRDKPIKTNIKQAFMMHVASCLTCRSKLSKSIMEELQPELSQLIRRHIMSKVETPNVDEKQRAQLDALIRETPSFQYLTKSVQRISSQFNGFKQRIEQIEEMIVKKFEKEQKPRAFPFSPPEEIPVAMQAEHRDPPGSRKPYKTQKGISSDLPPPFKGPPISNSLRIPPLPDLDTAEEFVQFENYLDIQRKKLAKQGIIPALPEGMKAEDALALGKKIIDFYEKWIDKIEINLTLHKIK